MENGLQEGQKEDAIVYEMMGADVPMGDHKVSLVFLLAFVHFELICMQPVFLAFNLSAPKSGKSAKQQ